MSVKEIFREGSTKKLYTTDQDDQLIMEFLDVLLLNDGKKKVKVSGKGRINAQTSAFLFEYLESYNVPTHFVKRVDENSLMVKKAEIVPIKLMIWNYATGTLSKRLGLKEESSLETPVVELYLKDPKLKNPLINEYHAYALGLCDRMEMNNMVRIATKINAVLKSFLSRKKMSLAVASLEFGRVANQIVVCDELSLDNLTVWKVKEDGTLDTKAFAVTDKTAAKVYSQFAEEIL